MPFIPAILAFLTTLGETAIIIGLVFWTIHSFLKVVGGPNGAKGFDNYIFNFLTSALNLFAKFVLAAEGQLAGIADAIVTAFTNSGPGMVNKFRGPIATLVKDELATVRSNLASSGVSTPDNAEAMAANAMAEAFAFGAASAAATAVFEAAIPEKLNTLNGVGPMIAQMAGFEDVAAAVRDPLYENAFGKSLEYYYRGKFKPELPDETDAVLWHARQLISDDQLRTIFDFSGLKSEYEDAYVKSAYRGISPFVMIRLVETGVFTEAQTRDELTFSGLRPQSQNNMIAAGAYLAAEPYRAQCRAALEAQYALGILSEPELLDQLDSLRNTNDPDVLIVRRASILRTTAIFKEYETAYLDLAVAGVIDEPTYISNLETLGLQPDQVSAKAAILDARLKAAALRQATAAERALERQTLAVERKTALQNFKSGTIDAAGLAATLALTGLNPAQVAAWTDFAVMQQKGSSRYVYGLVKTPADAQVLRGRVTALMDQRKKLFINDAQFLAELQALGIPESYQNYLLAQAAAQTTPKSQATWVPVQT